MIQPSDTITDDENPNLDADLTATLIELAAWLFDWQPDCDEVLNDFVNEQEAQEAINAC